TAKEMSAFSPPSPVTTSPAATPPVTTPPAAVPPTAVPPTAVPPPALSPERAIARRDAVRWFVLAIASLAVAAVFSLVLVVGRTPASAAIFGGDVALPRRSRVVHVNLALGVWFFAIIAGLFCLLPGARRTRTAPLAVSLATLGVIGFSIPMFFRAA